MKQCDEYQPKGANLGDVTHKKEFSGEQILNAMPDILGWLESKGLNGLNSRYSRYTKHIDEFFASGEPASPEGRIRFEKVAKSYIECLNIFVIHRAFKDELSDGFAVRLSKVADGQDHPDAKLAGSSRDYLFELLIAARLSLSGYEIDFDQITDVVAERDGLLVFGECKRLSSEKKFEENFKKAGKQIEIQTKALVRKIDGLVFLDVSSCLENLPKTELPNAEAAHKALKRSMNDFIKQNSSKIEQLNQRFSGVSLGACIIGQTPIWTEDATLHTVNNTSVIALENLSDDDFERLNKIVSGFSSAILGVV